jgi:aminotransferase
MEAGLNTYTRYDGIPELRTAIAAKQRRFTGMDPDPEREIVVSAGAPGALYCACLALLNPLDEVILFEPFYGYHVNTLEATGAVPRYVRMLPPHWSFSLEDLERAVTPRTKGIMVNSPANPSGKVFSRSELELVADFAQRHDLFVFTDEIYEHFLYDGNAHIPPMTLPGMRERTITISGVSKSFSVTGWRVGYCICSERWSRTIGHFNALVYVCAPAPLQIGVARGLLELQDDYYRGLETQYSLKREKICAALARLRADTHRARGAY